MIKKVIIFAAFLTFSTCYSIAQPSGWLTQSYPYYKNGKAIVEYELNAENEANSYFVWLNVFYKGRQIQPRHVSGDLGIVEPGQHQITWHVLKDSLNINGFVSFQVNAKVIPPVEGKKAFLKSMFFPGWGQAQVKKNNANWLYSLLTYGLMGGAVYSEITAINHYSQYQDAQTHEAARNHLNEATKFRNYGLYMAGGAGLTWTFSLTDVLVKSKKEKTKRANPEYVEKAKGFDVINSLSEKFHIQTDTIPPVVEMLSPEIEQDGLVQREKRKIVLKGQTKDRNPGASVRINDHTVPLRADGVFTDTIELSIGKNPTTIIARDSLENQSRFSFTVELKDTIAPRIVLTTPKFPDQKKAVTNSKSVMLQGLIRDKSPVKAATLTAKADGKTYKMNYNRDGNFSQSLKLNMGNNRFTLAATDSLMNKSTKAFTITYNPEFDVPEQYLGEIIRLDSILRSNLMAFTQQARSAGQINAETQVGVNIDVKTSTAVSGKEAVNLLVDFSYAFTDSTRQNPDAFTSESYNLSASNAARSMMTYMKEAVESQLIWYLSENMEADIRITAHVPNELTKDSLIYTGEFGPINNEPFQFDGYADYITIDPKEALASTSQLGYLRTLGVKDFIRDFIDPLNQVQTDYEHIVKSTTDTSLQNKLEVQLLIQNPFERLLASQDQNPPEINIFSPEISRGFKPIIKSRMMKVTGRITDKSGVMVALINGDEVSLSASGSFNEQVRLKPGENNLRVFALDSLNNRTEKEFTVDCKPEQDQLAQVESSESGVTAGDYYALLIGVNDYEDAEITDLSHPVEDIEEFKQVLTNQYMFEEEHVTVVKNPTRRKIINQMDNLSMQVTPNDNVLIFYAGHGWWDEDKEIGYWLPKNAERDNTANWLRNSTVTGYVGAIDSRNTLLVTDACFSGSIFNSRSAFNASRAINKLYEAPSRKAMTSGTLKEVPDESVFLEYLLKNLKSNKKAFISAEKLFSDFREAVINNSENIPQYGTIRNTGDEGGDFIFIKRR